MVVVGMVCLAGEAMTMIAVAIVMIIALVSVAVRLW
jgi:hypothetical protein